MQKHQTNSQPPSCLIGQSTTTSLPRLPHVASSPTRQPTLRHRRYIAWGTVVLLLAIAVLSVDLAICRLRPTLSPINPAAQLLTIPELFGDGLGILLILATLYLLHSARRQYLPRIAASAAVGAGVANVVKPFVWRIRPRALDDVGDVDNVFSTFTGSCAWTPWIDPSSQWERWMTSFPSAHTATAVGMAVGLSWLYPRFARCFAVLVVLVAVQRVVVGAHYPSDTLVGAALALWTVPVVFRRSFAGGWFDRLEQSATIARFAPISTTVSKMRAKAA